MFNSKQVTFKIVYILCIVAGVIIYPYYFVKYVGYYLYRKAYRKIDMAILKRKIYHVKINKGKIH